MAFYGRRHVNIVSSNSRVSLNTTSLSEANASYRVGITPSSTDAKIRVWYHIPGQFGAAHAANTIYMYRSFRIIGTGGKTYDLNSSGYAHQSRNDIAGWMQRPSNGHDGNDGGFATWWVYDHPNTTTVCYYGFEFKRETGGGGTMFFGYSQDNNSNWGMDSNITIMAEEID